MSDPMSSSQSTTDLAKERAAGVGSSAKESAQQVAGTATEQAGQVASEVSAQARNLVTEAMSSASEQAIAQRDKAVGGLRSLGTELTGMADKADDQSGYAAELARQASQRVTQVADFLDVREPGDLLDDVRQLARRRPGAFLVGAALAGVLAGRVTRGAVSAAKSDDSDDSDQSTNGYAPAVGTGYTPGYATGLETDVTTVGAPSIPVASPTPGPYTTEVEPGPYETTHGIDATGVREPTTGPLSGYEGRP